MIRGRFWTLVAASLAASAAAPASAQQVFGSNRINGIEIVRDGSPSPVRVAGDANFLSPDRLCAQWRQNKARLEQAVEAAVGLLNSSGKLPEGFQIVRQDAQLSPSCTAQASLASNVVNVNVRLPRNIFFFNLTTPTFLGQWADPRFSIDFDLDAAAQIQIPSTLRQGLALGPAQMSVFNVKLDGQNYTGDVAVTLLSIVKFFTGQDLAAELTRSRTVRFDGASADLGRIVNALGEREKQLPRLVATYDAPNGLLRLHATGATTAKNDRCISGYVWRNVTEQDHVCVTPAVRQQVRDDNARAAERRTSGPIRLPVCPLKGSCFRHDIPCKSGFVWRAAVPGDYVCVTPATRQQVQNDNAAAARRRMDYEAPVR